MPLGTGWVDVAAPFNSAQLIVKVQRSISTRYRDRSASLAPIAEVIRRQFEARPGNYLAFFSSFEYLEQVARKLRNNYPNIELWLQERGMHSSAQMSSWRGSPRMAKDWVCGAGGRLRRRNRSTGRSPYRRVSSQRWDCRK